MKAPILEVTCAVIEREGRILATRRSPEEAMAGKWEFPGGKIEPEETARDCILREIREELGIEPEILYALKPVRHRYPTFEILLYPFVCRAEKEELVLRHHSEARWDLPENLTGLDWAEADIPVLDAYRGSL